MFLSFFKGKVVAFFDSWPAKRIWPVDMAGFAININYLEKYPNASMPYKAGEHFLYLMTLIYF